MHSELLFVHKMGCFCGEVRERTVFLYQNTALYYGKIKNGGEVQEWTDEIRIFGHSKTRKT